MGFGVHLMHFERCACVREWVKLIGEAILEGKFVFLYARWASFVGFFGACELEQGEHKIPTTLVIYYLLLPLCYYFIANFLFFKFNFS